MKSCRLNASGKDQDQVGFVRSNCSRRRRLRTRALGFFRQRRDVPLRNSMRRSV